MHTKIMLVEKKKSNVRPMILKPAVTSFKTAKQ